MPDAHKIQFESYQPIPMAKIIPGAPRYVVDLVEKLLELSPGRRIKAKEVLRHTWFRGDPILVPVRMNYNESSSDNVRLYGQFEGRNLVDLLKPWLEEARERYERVTLQIDG